MTDASSIALLIPAFNAENQLPKLLRSALDQSSLFDEVWVYDDCSTDATAKVAAAMGARVITGAKNIGCSGGKAVLAEATSCDWVHFHDADDLLLPGMVAASRHWIATTSADVIVFGCEERWYDTDDVIGVSIHDNAELRRDPVGYTIRRLINSQCGLYNRASFLKAGSFDLDPAVLYNEDQAMHCQLARAGLRFEAYPDVFSIYFKNRASMSNSNQDKCLRAHMAVMLKALKNDIDIEHRADIAERLWHVAAGSAAHLDWPTADRAARLAMRLAGPSVAAGGPVFKSLCQISPTLAVRSRELGIRLCRPGLRADFPEANLDALIGTVFGWRPQAAK